MKNLVKRLRVRQQWLVAVGVALCLATGFAAAGPTGTEVTISSDDADAAEAGQDPAADGFESMLAGKRCDLQHIADADPGRFFDQGQTVLDLATDLMWVKCGLDGGFDGLTRSCWWADAEPFDEALDKPLTSLNRGLLGDGAGYNDWRVPSPAELATLPVACSESAVR